MEKEAGGLRYHADAVRGRQHLLDSEVSWSRLLHCRQLRMLHLEFGL